MEIERMEKFFNDIETLRLLDLFKNMFNICESAYKVILTCNYKDGTIRISFEEIESSDLLSNGVPKNAECKIAFGVF